MKYFPHDTIMTCICDCTECNTLRFRHNLKDKAMHGVALGLSMGLGAFIYWLMTGLS